MSSTFHSGLGRVPAVLGAALVLATPAVLAACGDQRASTATRSAAAAAVDHVQIKDFKYAPSTIAVGVGTTITWTNRDNAPHTATSGASPNADGVFDSGTITKGASKTVTVSKRGTFTYYCAFHPFMKGTVVVK
jgi:plastocyanin